MFVRALLEAVVFTVPSDPRVLRLL
jgi:hypothetical protein